MQQKISTDNRQIWIHQTLTDKLTPTFLEVIDQGWQHIGHAEEGAGHFLIRIASPQLQSLPLIEAHRLIYQTLGSAVGDTIHAIQIEMIDHK